LALMQILRVQTLLEYADEESASKTSYRKWEVTETEIKTCKSRLQCSRKLDMQLSGNTWDQTCNLLTPSCSRLTIADSMTGLEIFTLHEHVQPIKMRAIFMQGVFTCNIQLQDFLILQIE
jgi:hypothetical protein